MGEVFESIRRGLLEAIEYMEGNREGFRVHYRDTVDVRAIRERLGMSQREFSATIGVSSGTLRHWERGDRRPQGPAMVLLRVLEREPKAVFRALEVQSVAESGKDYSG